MIRSSFLIRPAVSGDAAWILPLSARLHDFGPPAFRPRERMDAAVARSIRETLDAPRPDAQVFVAEDEAGRPLGFIHVHGATDFFTAEVHGHVSDIVVAPDADGMGVGSALMAAGEAWSRALGHRLLTLNVFETNTRARRLYERLGYEADTAKLVKVLKTDA